MAHRFFARVIHDMYDRWYPWVFAALGLFCVVLAITNVALVVSNGSLRHNVLRDHADVVAALKARDVSTVQSCYQGAIIGPRVNVIVRSIAADHRARARQWLALASADPTAALRRVHLRLARQQSYLSEAIKPFPVPRMSDCNREARRLLGAKLAREIRHESVRGTRGHER